MIEWLKQVYHYLTNLNIAQIEELLQSYSSLGPLPGILLPLIESIFAFLPLFVIVAANASAYGFWLGFFYSWVGTSLGAVLVFAIARKFGNRYRNFIVRKLPNTERLFDWIQQKGFTPLFILYCFPFTPSLVVNLASGMSRVPTGTFIIAVMSGKAVMVFMMSYVGYDWKGLIYHPWRLIAVIIFLLILWFIGKKIENHRWRSTS